MAGAARGPGGGVHLDFPQAAEVFCMAVHREFHGRDVGTALLRRVEAHPRGDGVRFLKVKILGPSRASAEYD